MRTIFQLMMVGAVASLPLSSLAQSTTQPSYKGIGRAATAAEIAAWDIDVRADFKGLPKGAGSVKRGQDVWEAKCESCHGVFGESNEVFTPVIGGTNKADVAAGRVHSLTRTDYPQRTTMMKLSQVSTLWDYINRAMPWNAPKSLSVEDVYAVTAYVLHMGEVLPADFVLSDANIASVQARLPNRNGMMIWQPLWTLGGKGDTKNTACMSQCEPTVRVSSALPSFARNAHGNLQEQSRLIGPSRGVDTTRAAGAEAIGGTEAVATTPAQPLVASKAASSSKVARALASKYTCSACHQASSKLLGPSYAQIAKKYAGEAAAEAKLMAKVKAGGSGVWGAIPMPPSPQISEADLRTLVQWTLNGGQ